MTEPPTRRFPQLTISDLPPKTARPPRPCARRGLGPGEIDIRPAGGRHASGAPVVGADLTPCWQICRQPARHPPARRRHPTTRRSAVVGSGRVTGAARSPSYRSVSTGCPRTTTEGSTRRPRRDSDDRRISRQRHLEAAAVIRNSSCRTNRNSADQIVLLWLRGVLVEREQPGRHLVTPGLAAATATSGYVGTRQHSQHLTTSTENSDSRKATNIGGSAVAGFESESAKLPTGAAWSVADTGQREGAAPDLSRRSRSHTTQLSGSGGSGGSGGYGGGCRGKYCR